MSYTKKYYIKTWGCQMNEYDSLRIGEVLETLGYEETDIVSECDIAILNTCHIREKATEKVYSDIGRLRVIKERRQKIGKNLIIGISGCVAQAEGEEIIKRAPIVDLVFGPQTWHQLKEMIQEIEEKNNRVCNTDFPVEEKFDNLPSRFHKDRVLNNSAFIAIQEGCDKFCTYCVVPYTRGAEYSRPLWQVLNECDQLIAHGAKEITLLGQNVNAYHGLDSSGNAVTLGQLIRKLAQNNDLKRIRYVTSYPAEVDDDLISAHGDVEKLMPFLHLPIQSGSDRILKLMNRKHTGDDYLKLIDRFRKVNDKLVFSSDFIVGFPGETEMDFQDTLRIIKEVGFINAYSFAYSIRPGTPAGEMENQIDESLKLERLHILQDELAKIQNNFNQNSVGKIYDVLLNKEGKKQNQLVGKSPYMQAVCVDGLQNYKLGDIVNVKITQSNPYSLIGEVV